MAVNLSPVFGVAGQLFDNNGNPLAGGKIYTYAAGTTTPTATYTSSSGTVAHSNPIVLDGAGRVPSGEIWLTDGIAYKFVVEDSTNALIGTYDNLTGINSNFVAFTNEQEIQTATAGQTVFNLATMQYAPGTNSLTVFVDGVNQYGPGAQYAYVETDSDTVTFVSGLHVGASVKFTTSQLNSSGAVDASQVTYDPPFAGSVVTNVENKLSETISVKDFGAVGDGIANDTAAIALAVVAANGQSLYFPAGTYKITSTQTFSGIDNTSFIGDRFASVISVSSIIDAWSFDNTCTDLTFDGLVFAGQSVAEESKFALDIKGARCLVQNCYFYDFNQGVKINDENAVDCKIINNQFTDIKGATSGNGYGVYNIGSRTLISGNSFVSVGRHDIYLSGSSPQGSQFCTVIGNNSLSSGSEAIALYNVAAYQPVSGCVIDGNIIRSCTGIGIGLDVNTVGNTVSNNSIFYAGTFGIYLNGGVPANSYPNKNVISNNLIVDAGTLHIFCVNGSDNIFIGNSCVVDTITPTDLSGININSTGTPATYPTGNIIGNNFYSSVLNGPAIGNNAGIYYGVIVSQQQGFWVTATNNSATPSVANVKNIILSNSSATSITNFLNGVDGQEITLYFNNGNTTITLANAFLAGGVPFVGSQYDTLTLIKNGIYWYEKCRSVN